MYLCFFHRRFYRTTKTSNSLFFFEGRFCLHLIWIVKWFFAAFADNFWSAKAKKVLLALFICGICL